MSHANFIYSTKPVSFKYERYILQNWLAGWLFKQVIKAMSIKIFNIRQFASKTGVHSAFFICISDVTLIV